MSNKTNIAIGTALLATISLALFFGANRPVAKSPEETVAEKETPSAEDIIVEAYNHAHSRGYKAFVEQHSKKRCTYTSSAPENDENNAIKEKIKSLDREDKETAEEAMRQGYRDGYHYAGERQGYRDGYHYAGESTSCPRFRESRYR